MAAAMTAHLAYGALLGGLYGLGRERMPALPAPLAGALFGAATWVIGFEGWMPALGITERTTEKPPKKWPAPIMAHMVYGATMALVNEALQRREQPRHSAPPRHLRPPAPGRPSSYGPAHTARPAY